jgi:hypothetical protein
MEPGALVGPGGDVPAYRRLTRAQLGPARADFASVPPHRWAGALDAWARAAHAAVKGAGWLRTASVVPLRDRLIVVGPQRLRRLSADDAWSLAVAPLDAGDQGPLLSRLADAMLTGHSLADLVDRRDLATATIGDAEARSAQAAVLRWFTRRHPGAGGITSGDADALEAAASARVIALVPREIERGALGRCADCGAEAAPWFSRCDRCQASVAARGQAGRTTGGTSQTGQPVPAAVPPSRAVRRRRERRR